jgi:hypothetical protein
MTISVPVQSKRIIVSETILARPPRIVRCFRSFISSPYDLGESSPPVPIYNTSQLPQGTSLRQ